MIGYLINGYPAVSHSFIRREIQAISKIAGPVTRFSIRGSRTTVADSADEDERSATTYLFENGMANLVLRAAAYAILAPARFFRILGMSMRMWRGSNRPLAKHVASLLQATVLERLIRQQQIDHLHIHFGTNSTEVGMLAAGAARIPFSFTVHGPDEFDDPRGHHLAKKGRAAAFVVAISDFCASQLFRWLDVGDWDKVRIVRCGLSQGFFDEPITPVPDARHFVCVARLSAQKGHLLLLEAVAQIADQYPDVRVTLVGDGELRLDIERQIASLGLDEIVQISGWASEIEVRDYLRSARALVLPSFAEGLPVVVMEAYALGRPVLASNVAAMADLVENGETGWLFSAGSVDALASSMAQCLENSSSDLVLMALKGRARVVRSHDAAKEAEILFHAISEATSARSAPAPAPASTGRRAPDDCQ